MGDEEQAEAFYARAVARAREHGNVSALPFSLVRFGTIEFVLGKPTAALADLSEALRLARETGQEAVVAHALAVLAQLAAIRGEEDECRRFAAEAVELAAPRRYALALSAATVGLAELDLAFGRSAEAFDRLETLMRSPETHPLYRQFAVPQFVEAAGRAGRAGDALGAFARFEAWVVAADASLYRPLVARSRALVSEGKEAERAFADALRLHAEFPQPFDRARTELAYGELLRRARRKTEARLRLRAALETFEALGAAPWAERARAELRATGETVRRGKSIARNELTPQELQVARLAAVGSKNKEIAGQLFLSPKTVEYHLHKVFMKLGIASRAELAKLDLEGEAPIAAAVG